MGDVGGRGERRGYVALPRAWRAFAREHLLPHQRALLDDLAEACNWEPGTARVNGQVVQLDAGEALVSTRGLEASSGLTRHQVRTALDRFVELGLISMRPGGPPPGPPPVHGVTRPPGPPPSIVRVLLWREILWPPPEAAHPPGPPPGPPPVTTPGPIQPVSIQPPTPSTSQPAVPINEGSGEAARGWLAEAEGEEGTDPGLSRFRADLAARLAMPAIGVGRNRAAVLEAFERHIRSRGREEVLDCCVEAAGLIQRNGNGPTANLSALVGWLNTLPHPATQEHAG